MKIGWWKEEYMPFAAMVLVQLGYAGMNIFSKAAMDSGMTPYVLVTYRQIFATAAIAPFAFFLERMEKLKIRERAGQAKVLGTIVCVGGAMVLSFYHGPRLHVPQPGMHWIFVEATAKEGFGSSHSSTFLGPLLVIGCCVSQAFWLMVQTKLSQNYLFPFTNTTLMCFWSIFPSMLVSGIMNRKPVDWSLKSPIRLVSVLYAAIVPSAIGFWLMSWVAGKRGPLYVSIFNQLLLVFVAVLSWALLGEQLYVGTVLGAVLIVAGLYTVIWGKTEETKERQTPKYEHVCVGL
uniref:WAT1-related protein n=1 Tax=Kalanchoe fedtschenkoi TaxID=63787 RepID=A0A7N0TSI0_KALFE